MPAKRKSNASSGAPEPQLNDLRQACQSGDAERVGEWLKAARKDSITTEQRQDLCKIIPMGDSFVWILIQLFGSTQKCLPEVERTAKALASNHKSPEEVALYAWSNSESYDTIAFLDQYRMKRAFEQIWENIAEDVSKRPLDVKFLVQAICGELKNWRIMTVAWKTQHCIDALEKFAKPMDCIKHKINPILTALYFSPRTSDYKGRYTEEISDILLTNKKYVPVKISKSDWKVFVRLINRSRFLQDAVKQYPKHFLPMSLATLRAMKKYVERMKGKLDPAAVRFCLETYPKDQTDTKQGAADDSSGDESDVDSKTSNPRTPLALPTAAVAGTGGENNRDDGKRISTSKLVIDEAHKNLEPIQIPRAPKVDSTQHEGVHKRRKANPNSASVTAAAGSSGSESGSASGSGGSDSDAALSGYGEFEFMYYNRVGHKEFRAQLLSRDQKCVVTGTAIPHCLEAAHIMPYVHDSKFSERNADVCNGLLLDKRVHSLWDAKFLQFVPSADNKQFTIDTKVFTKAFENFQLPNDEANLRFITSLGSRTYDIPMKGNVEYRTAVGGYLRERLQFDGQASLIIRATVASMAAAAAAPRQVSGPK